MHLTAENVTNVFCDCLFSKEDIVTDPVKVQGVRLDVGFNPKKLEQNCESIEAMLNHLPSEFKKEGGGGWSFLNACLDDDGRQWGEHRNIDELICLGQATGKVSFMMPRSMWSSLPGGMPYFVIN